MATYTTQNPDKVERLVLYAPVWIRQTASLVQTGPGPLGAYRTVTRDAGARPLAHRRAGGQEGDADPGRLVRRLGRRHVGDRPGRREQNPPVSARAERRGAGRPRFFGAGKAYYDPAKITVPTLLVHRRMGPRPPPYMAQTLFPLLVNAPGKRYVDARRRHAHDHHGEEPPEAVRGGAGFLDEAGGS